jgi:plasmid stabilization system protein ParE
MARIIWTDPALHDTELIGDYHELYSPQQAISVIERIFQAVERLEVFPQSGHFVFDVPETPLREVFGGRYRILYSYSSADDACRIIAVANPNQNILRLLDDRRFDFSD